MRRRPQPPDKVAIPPSVHFDRPIKVGIVLSGGGSRAAYQIGVLKALENHLCSKNVMISVIVGSSIGAVNGLVLAAGLSQGLPETIARLEEMWVARTFKNSFAGSPSQAFLRSVKMAILRYAKAPSPSASEVSIFDPTPLMEVVDSAIEGFGGLRAESRHPNLRHIAVMTTVEGAERRPLLFLSSTEPVPAEALLGASFSIQQVDTLSAKHGFASAALPSILPPVKLDIEQGEVSLVDGGISQNIPVDPAVRLGAERVFVLDISGRDWWLKRYGSSLDSRPIWEVPAAPETFCLRPPETFVARCKQPLGPVLKQAVAGSTRDFLTALGPTWPIFSLSKARLGEEVAYEIMSYVALHPNYARALIELGYNETMASLRNKDDVRFTRLADYKEWYKSEKQVA